MNRILQAYELAGAAHAGQYDKGGRPYIFHPLFVAGKVQGESEKIVALLHDVLEDTALSLDDMPFLSEPEQEALLIITKNRGERYEQYLSRVKANAIARAVKLEDLRHNYDVSRLRSMGTEDERRLEKYRQALAFLER